MKPYMSETYYYVGETNEYFTQGNQYVIIETGNHWIKEYGEVAWLTCDDYPNTKDIDFGVVVDINNFGKGKDFIKY